MGKYVLDTNVLLEYPEIFSSNPEDTFIIHTIVASELDNQIHNKFGNNELAYKARQARNAIDEATNIEYCDYRPEILPISLSWEVNDDIILSVCKDNGYVLYTNDLAMKIKGNTIGVKCVKYSGKDTSFKGWRSFEGNTEWINNFHNDIESGINTHGLLINEYVELINTDLNESAEYRFDTNRLVNIKLPSSKVVKALNTPQRFALDLLYNKDIPIKVIVGSFGSGKTMLAVKMGLHMVMDKEVYKDIFLLRTPIVADNTDIGFLPGSKQEKTEVYFRPFLQYIENEKEQDYAGRLIREEKVKMDVVSFLKGINIEDSFIMMDECEDLNVKLLKLVGTRVGRKSCIVFTGDYKQAESKYKHDNGITQFIQKAKGNPLVGIVVLDEDVRSSASKVFADF